MKSPRLLGVVSLVGLAFVVPLGSQTQPSTGPASPDLYHVSFSKAVPGSAVALGDALSRPDPSAPMPDHFVVLRHQEGDDWDYLVIRHLGQKVAIDAAGSAPGPAGKLRAWHNDTFVSGPSWGEFTKAMGVGSGARPGAVYTVGVHRPVPGHREELLKALTAPGPGSAKVQTGDVLLQHLEGSDWVFLTITRHDSWQDFAADRTQAAGAGAVGWGDTRQHSAFHRDTIADRIYPK